MLDKISKELNILYVEDDEHLRVLLPRTLKLLFKDVICAENGAEALKIWHKNKIHIMIVDYTMPVMNGMEFIKEIRKLNKKIPIIILSAHSDKEKLKEAIKVGLIDYLDKPVNFDALFEALKHAIESMTENALLISKINDSISYDRIKKTLLNVQNKDIQLTKQEVALIELLLDKRGVLVSYADISNHIYDGDMSGHQLKNNLNRLKKKLGEGVISNVKELGYILR
jgi:DNA-binding response OmpR family regulator